MMYTAPCIMFWIRGEVVGVWALELGPIGSFHLGPKKLLRGDVLVMCKQADECPMFFFFHLVNKAGDT
jgi:hypothetical protein